MSITFRSDESVSYSIDGCELQVVSRVKDLGILIDNKLKFSERCFKISKKMWLSYICYSIRKLFSKRTPKQYIDLFKLYVRPIIDCNIVFWFMTYKNILKLYKIYKTIY